MVLRNNSQEESLDFAYGTVTLFGRPFQGRLAIQRSFLLPVPPEDGTATTLQPLAINLKNLLRGLGFSLFARRY